MSKINPPQCLEDLFAALPLPFQRCWQLAALPGAAVEPNPRVGAVVMHQGKIIGEGAHLQYGQPHAEVNALASVVDTSLLPDATLYVSLEPCNHHGKTPPCVDLILRSGIRKVVIGAVDPNPLMAGKSIALLRAQGLEVTLLEDQSAFVALNRHFETNQRLGRPHIVLKWAESADGFISGQNAMGEPAPRAISGMASNRFFHQLRHEIQGIWIGRRTAEIDNPSLTTRLFPGVQPLRIVIDAQLRLQGLDLKVLDGSCPTLLINQIRDGQEGLTRYWKAPQGGLLPILRAMYHDLKIGSVLVEGGRNLSQQFLDAGLWDEIYQCKSPIRLGQGTEAPSLRLNQYEERSWESGADQIHYFQQWAIS